jgi:glyoxylase-like metal-dependent hydrolase (beta-lactamase superfamily II)
MAGAVATDAVTTISFGMVNAYLLRGDSGFILVDTGLPNHREEVERAIEAAGCRPGDLRLIALTHGDYDHAGNASHLREAFGAKIGIHRDDADRVRTGDWRLGFKPKPDRFLRLFRVIGSLIKAGPFDTFEPDILLGDGDPVVEYGRDGRIVALPGHTRGSIGLLSGDGMVFCGDLLANMLGGPDLEFFIDDLAAARSSVARIREAGATTVYPGHGKPFQLAALKAKS